MVTSLSWRIKSALVLGIFIFILIFLLGIFDNQQSTVSKAAAPSGFTQRQVVSGLSRPTAMAIAPDGRIFVAEKSGKLRIIKNGSLLGTPFLSVSVNSEGERGLLGVALDPQFSQNGHVYVYYTDNSPVVNRISRFTAGSNPDVAASGSEDVLLDGIPSNAIYHNGGAIHFGTDGKLYVAVGDNQNGANAQSKSTLAGKVLRINKDGSIPSDNPFFTSASGNNRAIWALGFRNPFTFAVNSQDGTIFVNDVGSNGAVKREEINKLVKGGNYGWPNCEGSCSNGSYTNPIYIYGSGTSSTITGGAFYTGTQFPQEYRGRYFFGDFLLGWIKRLNPQNNQVADFATGVGSPVDIDMGPDGALYFISHNEGSISKIFYGSTAPTIPAQVTPTRTPTPTRMPGTITPTRTPSPTPTRTQTPSPTQSANQPPVVLITSPVQNTKYKAGDTISFSGNATDPEDGMLPASAFNWEVETVHNDNHSHPFNEYTGIKSGSFKTLTELGEPDASIKYRIILKVTDSDGEMRQVIRDVLPTNASFTIATNPSGLSVLIDSQPRTAPQTITGVVGYKREISTPETQRLNGVDYRFSGWSDGGARTHMITTPQTSTTYTATFSKITSNPSPTIRITSTPVPTRTPTPTMTPSLTPTATPKPDAFLFFLDLFFHGIGRGGDSQNPSSQGNSEPKNTTRQVKVEIYNPSDLENPLVEKTSAVSFDPNSGSFSGNGYIGNNLSDGSYILKVFVEGYLVGVSESVNLTKNQRVDVPDISLVTGDTDSNNILDILDYNNILSCFGNKKNSQSCILKKTTDLDDNGGVDGIDYNLFFRELLGLSQN